MDSASSAPESKQASAKAECELHRIIKSFAPLRRLRV
jgi:hypothetical protein